MYPINNRTQATCYAIPQVLNQNIIAENLKAAIIEAMGMASCQIYCIRCRHCSACKIGNRS